MKFKLEKDEKSGKTALWFYRDDGKKADVLLTDEDLRELAKTICTKLTMNEYQKKAKSTCTDNSYSYTYLSAGLVEETGEFFGKLAKMVRKGELPVNFTREDILALDEEKRKGLMLEGGDILWFVAVLMLWFGWSLENVGQANLDKLASRQQRGTIIGEGDAR